MALLPTAGTPRHATHEVAIAAICRLSLLYPVCLELNKTIEKIIEQKGCANREVHREPHPPCSLGISSEDEAGVVSATPAK